MVEMQLREKGFRVLVDCGKRESVGREAQEEKSVNRPEFTFGKTGVSTWSRGKLLSRSRDRRITFLRRGVEVEERELDGELWGPGGERGNMIDAAIVENVSRGASLPLRHGIRARPRKPFLSLCRDLVVGNRRWERENRQLRTVARQSENQNHGQEQHGPDRTGRRSSDNSWTGFKTCHDLRPGPRRSWPCGTNLLAFSRPFAMIAL